jgi:hypothetical protein
MVFLLTLLQHKTLGIINPSSWMNTASKYHCSYAEWDCSEVCIDDVNQLLHSIYHRPQFHKFLVVHDFKKQRITLHKFSDVLQYLSVINIQIEINGRKAVLKARSVSASAIPCFFPFCFLFGIFLFWLPFHDSNVNTLYLNELDLLIKKINPSIRTKFITKNKNSYLSNFISYIPTSLIFFSSFIVLPIFLMIAALTFFV